MTGTQRPEVDRPGQHLAQMRVVELGDLVWPTQGEGSMCPASLQGKVDRFKSSRAAGPGDRARQLALLSPALAKTERAVCRHVHCCSRGSCSRPYADQPGPR